MPDFDTMPAGRELDAFIAEKVFGLVPQKDFGEWPEHEWKRDEKGEIDEYVELGEYDMGRVCVRCHKSDSKVYGGGEGPCVADPHRYSRSGWALDVFEKIPMAVAPLGKDRYIAIALDEGAGVGEHYIDVPAGFGEAIGIAETLPLTICRAAAKKVSHA
jgi:hypothetical protein